MSDVDPDQFGLPKPCVNQQAIKAVVEKYNATTDVGFPSTRSP